jgi:tRNA(Arg) A34 adenosine deaminase TadA
MCLSALYWAGVSRIYYGNTQDDADAINFSDRFIYQELDKPKSERMIPCIKMDSSRTIKAFQQWMAKEDKIEY